MLVLCLVCPCIQKMLVTKMLIEMNELASLWENYQQNQQSRIRGKRPTQTAIH